MVKLLLNACFYGLLVIIQYINKLREPNLFTQACRIFVQLCVCGLVPNEMSWLVSLVCVWALSNPNNLRWIEISRIFLLSLRGCVYLRDVSILYIGYVIYVFDIHYWTKWEPDLTSLHAFDLIMSVSFFAVPLREVVGYIQE